MKQALILTLLALLAGIVLSVGALGQSAGTGTAGITFVENSEAANQRPPGKPAGHASDNDPNYDTQKDPIYIYDEKIPLSTLGDLPKTGGPRPTA